MAKEQAVALDVRTIPPRQRHPMIFDILEGLDAGQRLELTNDHDPKPLYYQIEATKPGQFHWEYVEQGPDVWRVHITRK